MPRMKTAVQLRDAVLTLGAGENAVLVLDHLNMAVPQGIIYGLIGASGCGKTTLLRCITGRLKLQSGYIRVLGGVPGTKDSGVPGPRIGYMPQETALVAEFSVQGVLYYFGWLQCMTSSEIAERYDFLGELLELPPKDRLVRDMSVGEARRLSLAAALVQTPELLILDEPTVGLDPILRQRIWNYLVDLTQDRSRTIILTTHYMSEAHLTHKIGLMRKGKLVAETSPTTLLKQCKCSSLDVVFLLLSQKQDNGESTSHPVENEHDLVDEIVLEDSSTKTDSDIEMIPLNGHADNVPKADIQRTMNKAPMGFRMKALLYKQVVGMLRSYGVLFHVFLLPVLCICAFFYSIGQVPEDMKLGIVNDELGNCDEYLGTIRNYSYADDSSDCHLSGLSCLYLSKLNDQRVTENVYYDSTEAALRDSSKGHTYGVIHLPSNFSENLWLRTTEGLSASNESVEGSEISVWLDVGNSPYGSLLRKHLYDTYFKFADNMSVQCNFSKKLARSPMRMHPWVLGGDEPNLTIFMSPGVVLATIFTISMSMTSWTIIVEMSEGIWERNLVAGMTSVEILSSHLVFEIVSMIMPTLETLFLGIYVFGMHCYGSLFAVVGLVFLQAVAGIAYGLLLSVICKDITLATYATVGTLLTYIFISGMFWPLEGMSKYLWYFIYVMPATLTTTSLRNIMERGWSWHHQQVWPGFAITVGWTLVLCLVTRVLLKRSTN